MLEGHSRCGRCRSTKLLSEFSPDKSRSTGAASLCKSCRRDICRRYRERHPERVKESVDRYGAKNRELLNDKSRTYRSERKEQISLRRKARWLRTRESEKPRLKRYRIEHQGRLYAKSKEWEARNPDKVLAKTIRYSLRQAGMPVVERWVEVKVRLTMLQREIKLRKSSRARKAGHAV